MSEMARPVLDTTSAPLETDKDAASVITEENNAEVSTLTVEQVEELRRTPFGSRYLKNPNDVYSFNAWDHVIPPPEWETQAKETLGMQREGKVDEKMKYAYNSKPSLYWNRFYDINKANFFKDRNWLRLEFPELLECAQADAGPKLVVEIGCGAGNTVFPLLAKNENPDLVVHACDYAQSAVELVKANEMYPVPAHGKGILHSSVWDVTTPPVQNDKVSATDESTETREGSNTTSLPEGVEPGTVDIAVMIFVMSALHPLEWQRAIANAYKMLKPNGLLFIRDYGRYDLAQLRIKKGRMLEENFYIRGDGTRVYFFEADELSEMLTGSKDAYEPMEVKQPTIEVDNEDSGTATPTGPVIDSETGSPLIPGTPTEEVPRVRHKPDDQQVETERLRKLARAVGAEHKPPAETIDEPLSTRFRPLPAGSTTVFGTLPRKEFPLHQTPMIEGEGEGNGVEEGRTFDPFGTPHEELGIPPMPLFRIDQLGVDRRMLVNRKRQLKMYRIWMQVKARKLV